MKTIYITTIAYNAEKTIEKTIQSILNQNYDGCIAYYILDNGSTDSTGDIIRKYAQKDSRIKAFYTPVNRDYGPHIDEFINLTKNINEDDYFCTVDADDEYSEDFLKIMVPFADENKLDVAACGSFFINTETGNVDIERVLQAPLIARTPSEFNRLFTQYHVFARTVWGKLYSGRVAPYMYTSRDLMEKFNNVFYGGDTLKVFSALKYANSFGIYPKSLHKYYISQKSHSYKWDENRPEADRLLYRHTADFLMKKVGIITQDNRTFLDYQYLSALYGTITVLFLSDTIPLTKKFTVLRDIFSDQFSVNAFSNERISTDNRLGLIRKTLLTISGLSETTTTENGIWLGINLSAMSGNQEDYIKYSIANIAFLINNNRLKEAENELNEWETLLPSNEQLKSLRKKLTHRK